MAPSSVFTTKAERGSDTAADQRSAHQATTEGKNPVKEKRIKEDPLSTKKLEPEGQRISQAGLTTSSMSMLTRWLYETRPGEVTFTEKIEQAKY